MAANKLAGQKILVTRPREQAKQLMSLIQSSDGVPILFPVIDIQPIAAQQWAVTDLAEQDWLIFVSRNAVEIFVSEWGKELPQTIKCAAVGKGTAKAMQQAGLRIDAQPLISNGSEGLLDLPDMQQMTGKKVLIVRGQGGRELLADTLTARGATIKYLEVYERKLPNVDASQLETAMQADKIVCTSIAGVDNLSLLLADRLVELKDRPLIVLSERIRQHALSLGFSRVLVTDEATDEAVMQQLSGRE